MGFSYVMMVNITDGDQEILECVKLDVCFSLLLHHVT